MDYSTATSKIQNLRAVNIKQHQESLITSSLDSKTNAIHPEMQLTTPIRAPSWFSTRRRLEQKLSNLHKCTDLNQLKQLHALIYKSNLHADPFIAPKLVSAFSLCRQMDLALNVFNQIQRPNVHLYNALIRALVHNSQPVQAFVTFFKIQLFGVSADNYTYPFLLKACTDKSWLKILRMIHAHVEKFGFYDDIFVPNSLIDAYCRCGVMGVCEAKKLFSVMGKKDIVTWNTMIAGIMKAGEINEARKMFDEMPEKDIVSWNTILDGYVKAGEMDVAFELFKTIPARNVVSWSIMVSGYSKAGDMEMARMFFDTMPVKTLVPWTIMVSGYAERGLAKEAIGLFDELEKAGLEPDDGAIVSILSACAESGLLGLGKRVHASIERRRYICSAEVSNALIDMYAKCGNLNKAFQIFKGTRKRDLVSWNAMIHGLAMHGHGKKALRLFSKMKQEGFAPDKVTLVGVLSACSHSGLIHEGLRHFYSMERDYGLVPEIEHYGCVIDLLGRRGRLQEAFRLIHSMPFEPNVKIWGALLGACRMHNAVALAEEVQNHLSNLEPTNAGNFSMLSNIYAAAGDWSSVSNARLRMKKVGHEKPSGVSSIMLDDECYEFAVRDTSHPKSDRIYEMINGLSQHLKRLSCVPEVVC